MKTRTARLIRLGILAARDPERMKHIRAAHPVVRAAARREEVRIEDRELRAKLTAMKAAMKAERHFHYWDEFMRFYLNDLARRMTPKPIPDTFKAAPKATPTFTVPAWHKHCAEPTPHAPISDAVARRAAPEQAEHLRRFYA